MEKDNPPQLVTPASVKAIISRIEAAQLTRAQEVTVEMREYSFHCDLMWQLGTDLRFGKIPGLGPQGSGILDKLALQTDKCKVSTS